MYFNKLFASRWSYKSSPLKFPLETFNKGGSPTPKFSKHYFFNIETFKMYVSSIQLLMHDSSGVTAQIKQMIIFYNASPGLSPRLLRSHYYLNKQNQVMIKTYMLITGLISSLNCNATAKTFSIQHECGRSTLTD